MVIFRRKYASNQGIKIGSLISDILQYAFAFIVILYGQTVWIRLNYNGNIYTRLCFALVIITSILILLQRKVNARACLTALILAAALAIYYLLSGYGSLLILRIGALLFVLVIYLWKLIDKGEVVKLLKKYSDIVILLTLISLVLYLFGSLLHILPSTTVSYFWAGRTTSCKTYFYFLFETQTAQIFGISFARNCSIFCEAPSYAVALSISLFIELFAREKLNKTRFIILLLGVGTSLSTKAILIAGVILLLKLYHYIALNNQGGKNARILKNLSVIALIIIAFVLIIVLGQKADSSSFADRMDNLYTSMLAFSKHPILGVGLGNEDAVSIYSRLSLRWQGFSMGATLLLAEGGIYIALFYIASFVKAYRENIDKWLVCSAGIVYFAILFCSNISFFPTTIFILALGFASHKRPVYRELDIQKQHRKVSKILKDKTS